MPACRRLPARFALAALAATVCVLAATSAAQAAGNPLQMTIQVGYSGMAKAGEWMPVAIDVTNNGPDVEGSVEILVPGSGSQGLPLGDATYELPLSLAAGTTKHLRTYVAADSSGGTLTVWIVRNGRVLVTQTAVQPNLPASLIGVVSDQPTALDDFAAVHPGGITAGVAHLRPEDLSESALVLRAFDLLVIDDYATDTLTQGQRAAIADYVDNGGFLMVGTGAAWHKTLAGLPAAILPMQVTGTTTLGSSRFVGGTGGVEVATGTPNGGRAWLSEGGQPLLLEKGVGSGAVIMATFDWNQAPVFGAAGTDSLLRQIEARTILGFMSPQFTPFGMTGAGVGARSGNLISVLGNLPSLDLPSLQLTGVLVALYVLLVGPINYFVLGRLRRRALAWITVPLIAIIAAGGAYSTGVLTKGRSVQTNQVSIVHLQPGWDRAYQETYMGVVPPARGDYDVRVSADKLLISPISSGYSGPFPAGASGPSNGAIRVGDRAVLMPGMTAFTLRGFATEGLTAAPRLTGKLQLVNGKLVGSIQNQSTTSFTDAVLIAGDAFQLLGPLKPGSSTSVSLTPVVTSGFGGPPAWTTIYGSSIYGTTNSQPSGNQRDNDAKTQILALLPLGTGFKGITSIASPMVVAWTKQSFEQVTVNGSQPRSEALSAVALSLPIEQVGVGPLPPGLVAGRVVDLEGGQQGGPPGMVMLTNGSVTYDFWPSLAPGTHLTGASLNASNLLAGKGVPASGANSPASALTGEAWDWSHSTWIAVDYQDNGTISLPDSAVDPSTGEVRLKVTATNSGGSFISTGISLTGTVR